MYFAINTGHIICEYYSTKGLGVYMRVWIYYGIT